jgi:hypothetical protein
MVAKITLAVALLVAAVAIIPAGGGVHDVGQAALRGVKAPTGIGGSAGGNFVPVW